MSIHETLLAFISSEPDRFDNEHNNMFAFAFAEVGRYRRYLDVVLQRYLQAGKEFIENTQAMQARTEPGTHPVTPDLQALHDEGARISDSLHQEIETFYLFAKILLDKLARAIEFYFGTVRRRPLDSHDDLTKNLRAYAESKNLQLDPALLVAVDDCRKQVSDYRDHNIAHEKSPRTMRGTLFSHDGGKVRMFLNRIYPSDNDSQVESIPLDELMPILDRCLEKMLDFVVANKERTNLTLEVNR